MPTLSDKKIVEWGFDDNQSIYSKSLKGFPRDVTYHVVKFMYRWKAKLVSKNTRINFTRLDLPYTMLEIGSFKTKEEAKAACQDDLNHRVLPFGQVQS